LRQRLGIENRLLRMAGAKARQDPRTIVFSEAENQKILRTAQLVYEEGIALPILLGNEEKIKQIAEASRIDLTDIRIIDPKADEMDEKRKQYGELFFNKRKRKGFNQYESSRVMKDRNYFGCMMVESGDADAMLSGLSRNYPDTIRPALQTVGLEPGVKRVAGMYVIMG